MVFDACECECMYVECHHGENSGENIFMWMPYECEVGSNVKGNKEMGSVSFLRQIKHKFKKYYCFYPARYMNVFSMKKHIFIAELEERVCIITPR